MVYTVHLQVDICVQVIYLINMGVQLCRYLIVFVNSQKRMEYNFLPIHMAF